MRLLLAPGRYLRPWQPGDEADLCRHANSRAVWRNLRDRFPYPYTEEDARAWVRACAPVDPPQNLAIVDSGVGGAVGGIGLIPGEDIYRHSAEVGYWLGEAAWGRGLATLALRAFCDYAFATFDLRRLWAGVFSWNPASCRVLEKAGFCFEGRQRDAVTKDGQVLDLLLYALLRPGAPAAGDP
jgi:RimJ/RimL family protein N-acetyltransferase